MELLVFGAEASLLALPLVAFVISFFTSMAGVSGAFLLLPFQVSVLGFTSPAVSATNHLYNVLATPSGVARYAQEGRMLWPLAWILALGTIPGVLIGAFVRVHYLPDPVRFKLFAGMVLLCLGGRILAGQRGAGSAPAAPGPSLLPAGGTCGPTIALNRVGLRQISYVFAGKDYEISTPGVVGLSLVVGMVGGTYGVGGGAFIAPLLVTGFGLPVHSVAGATLGATGVASLTAVVGYQAMALLERSTPIAPDWTLGLLFGLGGMAGMFLGARCQGRVPARAIEWMLGLIVVLVAIRYILDFFA